MFDYNVEYAIKELFLFEYVLADAVNAQDLFGLLCDVYCIDDKSRDELSELLQSDKLTGIHTFEDYCREMRLKQYYNNFRGGYAVGDERVEELVAIKGAVFEQARNNKLLSGYDKSCSVAYDELVRLAFDGLVCAKRLLGIMQAEGIYITQDTRTGLENLQDAADWSDIQALVTLMHYSPDCRKDNLDKLYTVTEKTDHADIAEQMQMQYDIGSCDESATAKLMEKAFESVDIKREICIPQYLRTLRSNVLSDKDKRTVLLSGSKELVHTVCGLPLNLSFDTIGPNAEVKAVLDRSEEKDAVMRMIGNNGLRNRNYYRCMCISSNSEYIRDAYSDMIGEVFGKANVVSIDVASLMPIDLDATENNIFIRSCREKSVNVFIIKLCGKIDERIVSLVKTFATGSIRKSYPIARLGINIDLSAVLPILVCDRRNEQLLGDAVNVIKAADVAVTEKQAAIEDILRKKRDAFGIDEISMEDEANDILSDLQTDKVGGVVDRAVMLHCRSDALRLSAEIVRSCIDSKDSAVTYGFGGKKHAGK